LVANEVLFAIEYLRLQDVTNCSKISAKLSLSFWFLDARQSIEKAAGWVKALAALSPKVALFLFRSYNGTLLYEVIPSFFSFACVMTCILRVPFLFTALLPLSRWPS